VNRPTVDPAALAAGPATIAVSLDTGWQIARGIPDAWARGTDIAEADWSDAAVPGTAAGATGAEVGDYDADDWWFRLRFAAAPAAPDEEVWLTLEGIASVYEVELNGEPILDGDSMHARHEINVTDRLRDQNTLVIVCRALRPRLTLRRKPRARWRTRLVSAGNLRFHRTMLLGRAPGFAPGPAVVGPYREVGLIRRRGCALADVRLRTRLDGEDGVISVSAAARAVSGASLPDRLTVTVTGPDGVTETELTVGAGAGGGRCVGGEVRVPRARRWWPHTHGTPVLYAIRIGDGERTLHTARAGFRSLRLTRDLEADGLGLELNGEPVFARGAVWTPADLTHPAAGEAQLRVALGHVVAAGMNMLRVAGIGAYESDSFHDLCDELGILVWQDFMFANLDYPEFEPDFMAAVRTEAETVLAGLAGRPSLAVLCGGSEVAQQVAMLGLDPALACGPLYGELLPELIAAAGADAPYVPSAPWGGDVPFRPDRGVANYYGVGAYLRPVEDARRADVRFAAECLAFANVPDEDALGALTGGTVPAVHDPAWKAGVPRDAGAGWDFDDVRDHYLASLFGVDPVTLRSIDPERYRELSRAVTGEVMAEVFGEWRRRESACAGGLVLWLQDHRPGAGWGLLDHRGVPKVAYHHLRRALAPVAVWSSDEGLGGIVAHVANDVGEPLEATLRVALYREGEHPAGEASIAIGLAPHAAVSHNVEALLGRFVDVGWAYRFGPPAQDLVVLSLERRDAGVTELLSQAFRFPAGRLLGVQTVAELGLTVQLSTRDAGEPALVVRSRRFAHGVRTTLPGWVADDDAFGVEPGHERRIALRPTETRRNAGTLTALNLAGSVRISGSGEG